MKILVNMKLGYSKVDSKLRPLAQLNDVDQILVVRDYPGPDLKKVEYHCPPRFISRLAVAAAVYKLLVLIYLSLSKKPGLIHSYLLFPHGILAFIAARLTGRPVGISLIAGAVELYSTGSPLGVEFTRPFPWFGRLFLRMLRNCDIVTATGSSTRDFLIAHGIDKDRTHILPHSASENGYYPMDIPRKYDVILVGSLIAVKHVEVLLKAVSKIRERHRDIKAAVIGDGPCRSALENLSVEMGTGGNIDFLGFQEDVTHYYNSARVFVLTSEREGFPSVVIEAMMCGIPPVVSNCGDIVDITRDGFNAIVIPDYRDADGFADAILNLLEDKELHHRLSRNVLATVRELSVENVAQAWGDILKSLGGKADHHE